MGPVWYEQILADTGAAVLTKGVWYPDKSMATDKDPALYLHISAVRCLFSSLSFLCETDTIESNVRTGITREVGRRYQSGRGIDQSRFSSFGL